MQPMRQVAFRSDGAVPVLGQGTWQIGESRSAREAEIATLRRGLDLGMTLIDTAEMYGDGASEELIGSALAGQRDEVFLVSKFYPQNAGRTSLPKACEASLRRLGTDRLDLYLLHWRGSVPLGETVQALEQLVAAGKILRWGVSNFDVDDMTELFADGGEACAANQILYNVTRRGPEFDLLPWMRERGVLAMAYSPIEQGRLRQTGVLGEIAAKHACAVAAVALAFAIRDPNLMAVPKASSTAHVEANRASADLSLDADDLARIDQAFPPPRSKQRLDML